MSEQKYIRVQDIRYVCSNERDWDVKQYTAYEICREYLSGLPCLLFPKEEPMHKGAWGKLERFGKPMVYECSCCGEWQLIATKFCPNCGADMRRKDE